jgi:hypothetical protein
MVFCAFGNEGKKTHCRPEKRATWFGTMLANRDPTLRLMNSALKVLLAAAAGLACASAQIPQRDLGSDPVLKNPRIYNTWTIFLHPSSGFELPIPPGVSALGNPEAADEPQFRSADRNFVMSAWGGLARESPSKVIAAQWNQAQRKAGRSITYQRRGSTWFVVSGTDSRGIEFYEKFTMRGQHVAFLDITFPRSRIRQYEPWVETIENGFRPVALRDGPPGFARQLAGRQDETAPLEPRVQRERPTPAETAPAPKNAPKPTERATKSPPSIKETTPIPGKLPSAEKVAGKPGFVFSPFSTDQRIVDVSDIPSGTKVKCPYTMKIFVVP